MCGGGGVPVPFTLLHLPHRHLQVRQAQQVSLVGQFQLPQSRQRMQGPLKGGRLEGYRPGHSSFFFHCG